MQLIPHRRGRNLALATTLLVFTLGIDTRAQQTVQLPPPQVAVVAPVYAPPAPDLDIPQPPRAIADQNPKQFQPVPQGTGGLPLPASPPSQPPVDPAAGVVTAPCDFRYFIHSSPTLAGVTQSSNTGEPTTAMARDTAIYTGNWYAGLSNDSGQTWRSVSPYTRFPARDGGFCCDQRVLHVASSDMTFWLLEYSYSATSGVGSLRLAVARGRDNLRNDSWYYYDLTPATFGLGANFLDYSDIAAGTTNLYGSCIIGTPPNSAAGLLLYRINLAQLAAGGSVNISYYTTTQLGGFGSYRFAQGATSTMHWAAHTSTTNLRVYSWGEAAAGAAFNDRGVATWSGAATPAPGPDARDWTGFGYTVNTVLSGWANATEMGFMWSSGSVAGRPMNFVRHARFRQSDRALLAQDDIWSTGLAWHFPSCAANAAGNVGGTIAYGGGTFYPSAAAFIVDPCTPAFAPLTSFVLMSGGAGPSSNRWGDYAFTTTHPLSTNTWVGTGYARATSTGPGVPHFAWFGREQDEPTWVILNVNSTPITGVPITVDVTDRFGAKDGSTNFTRSYAPQQGYQLTAPASRTVGATVYVFDRWALNGGLQTVDERVLDVPNIGVVDDTAEAQYRARRTLTVQSTNPASGVAIAVSVLDLNGNGDGSTSFSRLYKDNATVTLTAPAAVGANPFKRWRLGGVNQALGLVTLNVSMASDATAVADYYIHSTGSFTSFGAGCAGSGGVDVHTALGTPETGQVVSFRLTGGRASSSAILVVGFSRTSWLGIPLPLPLGAQAPGCTLYVSVDATVGTTTNASGVAGLGLGVPNDVTLIGGHLFTQFWCVDLFANPLNLTFSNGVDTLVGGNR